MKFQLAFLVSFIALAMCKPAEDTGMAQLLLRSCDHNADNALNAAEFAGCLMGTSKNQRMAASRMGISRAELLQSFMDEADLNNDLRADKTELQEWSARWFLSGLFGGNDCEDDDEDCGDDGDGGGFKFSVVISKIVVILQYISEENYVGAAFELYALVADYEFSSSTRVTIRLAAAAIEDGEYGEAVGFIYSVIREIAGGDEAGGIFIVSANTVTNIASLLQAIIRGDSALINFYIYRSLAGVIVDFSFLSEESASSVAALIQAVIEYNSDAIYESFSAIIVTIDGISSATSRALRELLDVVINGPSSEISAKIFAVLIAVFEDENAAEVAQLFVAVIQAVIDGDSDDAIEQLTLLYAKITEIFPGNSGPSSASFVALSVIIEAVQSGNSATALAQIRALIRSSSSGLSDSQISALRIIIDAINDGDDDDEIIALLIAVASGGSSSSSSSAVVVSVDVFLTLSSVITVLEDSEDADEAIALIEAILSDSSITISIEVRVALQAAIYVLEEGSVSDALEVVIAVVSGSSKAFDRKISSQVASQFKLVLAALNDDDADAAIVIIKALLNGARGGSSLSYVVRYELSRILIALEDDDILQAYAQLVVISVGERSSSVSVSATAALLIAFEYLSSGDDDDAIEVLEELLDDDDIESSFEETIEEIIAYIEDGETSQAQTAIIVAVAGSGYSISASISRSLFTVLQRVIARQYDAAIAIVEGFLNDLAVNIRLLVIYLIRLLRQRNYLAALTIVNVIISEAD